jgi:O-antigen biosynthesis protein
LADVRRQVRRIVRAPRVLLRVARSRLFSRRHRVSLRTQLAALERRPLITIVLPVYRPKPRQLRAALRSARRQAYESWELCVYVDGPPGGKVERILRSAEDGDPRIRVEIGARNEGIARATNRAVAMGEGEYVAMLDQDDMLSPSALLRVVERLLESDGADAVYSDQAKMGRLTHVLEYFYKPDWSPIYALGAMYVGHLLVVRRGLLDELGGFDPAYDGIQDYELMLRLTERTSRIEHIPEILYMWRATAGSLAAHPEAKPEIGELQVRAVNAHLARAGIEVARAAGHPSHAHRVRLVPARPRPESVSIVIPSRDHGEMIERCLSSIAELTAGPAPEVVIVDGGSTDPRALAAYERWADAVVDGSEGEFNYSRANNAGVERAGGDLIVLFNNDVEVLEPDWLDQLAMYAALPRVGAVGPQLVYPDRTIQHAGVVLGTRGTADHAMRGFDPDADGYAGSLSCAREVSAVTGACLCMRRDLYLDLGGMNTEYAVQYQDVDLCMRIRARGLSVLYAPRRRLVHHESASRGKRYDMVDRALLIDSWWDEIRAGDTYYNRALSVERADYSLAGRR